MVSAVSASGPVYGLFYVPGGLGGERLFQAYDPAADAWLDLPNLPEPRHHLMSAAYGGKVYIFGGASSLVDWTPRAEACLSSFLNWRLGRK